MDLKLVVFDVDGTLVDSQGDIMAAMTAAFDAAGLPVPSRDRVLGIVGLSLPEAMARLAPDHPDSRAALVDGYKSAYMHLRAQTGVTQSSPLFAGMAAVLDALQARDDVLLGVATGKSRRGLDKLIDGYGWHGRFVTRQVADDHPSKPHPSMLLAALSETGVAAGQAVMIGDTSYDMDMARAAGIAGIGVTWGYHARPQLAQATHIAQAPAELLAVLDEHWSTT